MDLNENIAKANHNRYQDGKEVVSYLSDPYHKVRVKKSVRLLRSYIKNNFPDKPRQDIRILEIAGASGTVSMYLRKLGYDAILTDIETEALNRAKEKCSILECKVLDASRPFPFEDNSVHAIYAGEIIEHLFDTGLFFLECARCLKPGGVLILTTPNLATLQDRIRFVFGKSPRQVDPVHEYLYLHIRPFTVSKLKEIARKYNFTGLTIRTNMVVWRCKNKRIRIPLLDYAMPSLGGSIIMGCYLER